jgi:hypothetical protein
VINGITKKGLHISTSNLASTFMMCLLWGANGAAMAEEFRKNHDK